MNGRIFETTGEISAQDWNRIVARNHITCRHEFLQAVEQSRINDCEYRYVVVEDDRGIAACAACCVVSTELDTFARGFVKTVIGFVKRLKPNIATMGTVECGCPVALGNTISIRKGVDCAEVIRITDELITQVACEFGVKTIVWRDFGCDQLSDFDELLKKGYRRVMNLPEMWLRLRWRTFDEYLDAMRSKFRSNVLAQQRRFASFGGKVDVIVDYGGLEKTFAGLWRNVYDRAREYRREVLLPEFFANMRKSLGPRVAAIVGRIDARIVGFLFVVRDEETLITLFSGLDYEINRASGVYFNLFYKAIECGIQDGMRGINLGLTTVAPKLDLGAEVVPLYMYMKSNLPLIGPVVPRLFAAMTPTQEYQHQPVFKRLS